MSRRQSTRSARAVIATLAALTVAATGGAFFAADAATSQTERVSVRGAAEQGNSESKDPAVSADGRYVAFNSRADNLVRHDTNQSQDVFVRDRLTQQTERVSVGLGHQANGPSFVTDISANGRYVVFASAASNLAPGDRNGQIDIFVRDRRRGKTVRVSVSNSGVGGNAFSHAGAISARGRFVAFESAASNLVPGDTNRAVDIFVRDFRAGTTRRVSVSNAGTQANHPPLESIVNCRNQRHCGWP